MSEKIIDPHVHFFNLIEGQYSWLQGEHPPVWPNLDVIKLHDTPDELQKNCSFELAGLVHIEAGFDNHQPINELKWLEKYLTKLPYKAISFAKIDSPPHLFGDALTALSHPTLIGIRDITQGTDAARLEHNFCVDNLSLLAEKSLLFEAQFEVENSLATEKIIAYATQFPHLTIVINHAGLPNNLTQWQDNLSQLAKRPNCLIKFSGFELLTPNTQSNQQRCFDFIVQLFGQYRIMFASNFPVCQINSSHQQRWDTYHKLCNNEHLWKYLSYKNAHSCYQV